MLLTINEALVLLGGVGLIGFIAYYFFGPKEEATVAKMEEEVQTARIVVDAAYIPSEIKLKRGVPTELSFERKDKGECTDWVIILMPTTEGDETKKELPEGKTTIIHFTPTEKGSFDFSCGMGMVHGKIIVS